jgi:glycosyltransferase involved in cell wall biosynthesis
MNMLKFPTWFLKPTQRNRSVTGSDDSIALTVKADNIIDEDYDLKNWRAAAYNYQMSILKQPKNFELHLQLGNIFKDLGLYWKAENIYLKAIDLNPTDPEPYFQLATLAKIVGKFASAEELFRKALLLGYTDKHVVEQEIAFLGRTDGHRNPAIFVNPGRTQSFRVFLSSIMGSPPPDTVAGLNDMLGLANYSYSFIVSGYMEALEQLGIDYEFVVNPEYVPDIRGRSSSAVNIHIGFYPPSEPRILKGAYNIFVIAWEFERLPVAEDISSHHAFSNPGTMLSLANEIWSISEFGAEAIRSAVTPKVHTVPTPVISNIRKRLRLALPTPFEVERCAIRLNRVDWVPLAIVPQILDQIIHDAEVKRCTLRSLLIDMNEEKPVFFLSIMNVNDFRKQIKPAIEAFVRFAKEHPNAFMLLKLTISNKDNVSDNEHLFKSQIADLGEVTPPYVSDQIWITSTVMSREELINLYDICGFYISTSHGEGQNLPLIEAMARGVVPVSVDHTAMKDYINHENSIIIKSESGPLSVRLAARYRMSRLNTFYVRPREVYEQLNEAISLSPEAYAEKSVASIRTVVDKFGVESFGTAIARAVYTAGAQHAENEEFL